MIKGVLKNGLIHPQEPLPEDWTEGVELEVERADSEPDEVDVDAIDRWFNELEAACAQGDPEDDRIREEAIDEIRRQEKELARKQMGLD